MKKFNKIVEKNMEKLNLYVPVVERVHGGSHPEFYDVRKLFDKISEKIGKNETEDLEKEFLQLRKVTNNYSIPKDVCESYEAVYNMLEELDRSYRR